MMSGDIIKLVDHEVCPDGITGFKIRFILVIYTTSVVGATAMAELTVDKFFYDDIGGWKLILLKESVLHFP